MSVTQRDILTLAQTIYGEARGEYKRKMGGLPALIGVANVIMNRSKRPARFGKSIHSVCKQPHQFSCWNKEDPNRDLIASMMPGKNNLFDLCYDVAEKAAKNAFPDLTKGSDHYHAPMSCPPKWTYGVTPQITIGQHTFYKLG